MQKSVEKRRQKQIQKKRLQAARHQQELSSIKMSKRISYLLRHHPEEVGLHMDPYGYVEIQ